MTTPRNIEWEHNVRLLRPGWNNYKGTPITEEAIAAMRKLLAAKPQVVPLSNGGLQLEWDQAEIVIRPDGVTEDDAALEAAPEPPPAKWGVIPEEFQRLNKDNAAAVEKLAARQAEREPKR